MEKNPHLSGPTQFKPCCLFFTDFVLFKGQLHFGTITTTMGIWLYLLDRILGLAQILQRRGICLDRRGGKKFAQQKLKELETWVNIAKRYSFTRLLMSTHICMNLVSARPQS